MGRDAAADASGLSKNDAVVAKDDNGNSNDAVPERIETSTTRDDGATLGTATTSGATKAEAERGAKKGGWRRKGWFGKMNSSAEGEALENMGSRDGLLEGGEGEVVWKVYKRRWFGLLQLVLLNVVVSWDVSSPFALGRIADIEMQRLTGCDNSGSPLRPSRRRRQNTSISQ